MCNEQLFSESGASLGAARCKEYIALKEENARLRSIIVNVIAEYDACDGFNNEGRAAELINVTLREAMKEVG